MQFTGQFEHQIEKGRLFIPRRAQGMFETGGQLIVSWNGKCLVFFPHEEWLEYSKGWRARVTATVAEQTDLVGYFNARLVAEEIDRCLGAGLWITLDAQGRITIPAPLREAVHIEDDVVILCAFNRVELWDKQTWLAHQSTHLTPTALTQAMSALSRPAAIPAGE
jgi:MraZ protein